MAFTGISHDSAGLSTPWESYPPNSGSYQHIKGESDDCSGRCYSPFTLSLSKGPLAETVVRQAHHERGGAHRERGE